ncbi:Tetraacyldisaccharide 4'-kinase [Granulibacter bethesdensis]|nr:tetraacyldisaccharide 4'-kinase [Granulibacter bethesdensis]APH60589.1 Tetraacyldisaccharide 4'-kinase [Granulibacter bethesdensis]
MIRTPGFWLRNGPTARLLAPASALTAAFTAHRVARPGWRAPVPVVCCGNATVGGAGKTTIALDLIARLKKRGFAPHALTRGYRGRVKGVVQVQPDDTVFQVGDEALLLAASAPCWVAPDRAAAAREAIAAGASVLVMDDGLQNPGLARDLSLLIIDGAVGFGNGRVLPAGPLREPVAAAAARCRAAVIVGDDVTGTARQLPAGLQVLRAHLTATGTEALIGRPVLAFAGIGRPAKFAETLTRAGVEVVELRGFPDHHVFTERDLTLLAQDAAAMGAILVTTPKDAVRLRSEWQKRVTVSGVRIVWEDEQALDRLLDTLPTRHDRASEAALRQSHDSATILA